MNEDKILSADISEAEANSDAAQAAAEPVAEQLVLAADNTDTTDSTDSATAQADADAVQDDGANEEAIAEAAEIEDTEPVADDDIIIETLPDAELEAPEGYTEPSEDDTVFNSEDESEGEADGDDTAGGDEGEGDGEAIPRDADTDGNTDENTDEVQSEKTETVRVRMVDRVFDFVELFIFSLVAVLLATTFVFRHSIVEGSSMEQTLYENEHLIISNLFYTPERGDIIVCEDYTTVLKKPIVKRVIGLPGDRVVVRYTGEVYVNGELLDEPYVYVDFYTPQYDVDVVVPEGELFVMGDHRNLSTDSREIGTIDMDSVLGKVLLRFLPISEFGIIE